ncbi:MAG: ATP-dependent metallopeptidase FtsH/Yme1/Tma family protein, partial [Candidatus Limnocylindrus sp.]
MIPKALRNGAVMLLLLLGTVVLLGSVLLTPVPAASKDYSAFLAEVREGSVASVVQQEQTLTVTKTGTPPDTYQVQVPTQLTDVYNDVRAAATAGGRNPDSVTFGAKKADESGQLLSLLVSALLPVLLIGGLFVFMMRSAQGQNNQAMSFGKSKAKMFIADKTPVTFA